MCAARTSRRRQEMADGLINALGIYESTLTGSRQPVEVPALSTLETGLREVKDQISSAGSANRKLTHCRQHGSLLLAN